MHTHTTFSPARRLAALCSAILMVISMSRAQDPFQDAIKQLNTENLTGYLQPFTNSVGANMNSGLYNTAQIPELGFSLQFQIIGMGTMVGDNEKKFTATPPGPFPQSPVETATVFGDIGTGVAGPSNMTYYFQNGQIRTSLFPTAVPQLTIGNFYGTQGVVRYITLPNFKNFPKTTLFGIGAQHSISRYFQEIPLDLAVGIYYNKFDVGEIIETKSMAYAAHASKSLSEVFTAYGGLQYETTTMDVNYSYSGPGSTPDNKSHVELESENKFRFMAGFNLNLGILHLNGDINFGKVIALSGGIGFGI